MIKAADRKDVQMNFKYGNINRVLTVLAVAGILCASQAMTAFAGTTGLGASRSATSGPGAVSQEADGGSETDGTDNVGQVTVDTGSQAGTEEGSQAGAGAEDGGQAGEGAAASLQVNYSAYMAHNGWSAVTADNQPLVSPGGAWLTAIQANLINIPQGSQVGIRYRVNLSGKGWLDWSADGAQSGGPEGEMPLEAVCMELTGSAAEGYDLYYKVYQNGAWTDWATAGATAGTEGAGLRIDGIRAAITARGAGAPQEAAAPVADPSRPMIALTFDDGPKASVTSRILDSLEANGGRATFFMLGSRVGANGAVIQRMASQGSEVANHTYDHKYLTKLDANGIISQVGATNDRVAAACGISPVVMRPPGGYIDAKSLSALASMGMPAIMWSIDTRDWQHRNAQKTIDTVLSQVKDGDIILMHDIYDTTADAAVALIPELTARGYQLVTVSELASLRGGLTPGQKYSQFRP